MTQGKQLSKKMLEIIRAAQIVKTHAYDQPMNPNAELQMQSLAILVQEGKELMNTIKPSEPDTSMVGVILDLDGETLSVGKVTTTSKEKEDKEEEKDKS